VSSLAVPQARKHFLTMKQRKRTAKETNIKQGERLEKMNCLSGKQRRGWCAVTFKQA